MKDFNDLYKEQGADAVKERIEAAIAPKEEPAEAVNRLAKLSALEYEQVREDEAEKLGIRVSALDKEVTKQRFVFADANNKPAVGVAEVEPWPDEVDGQELFADLVSVFSKYLALQKYQAEALALWCMFSYNIDAGNIAPKLLIYSPEKRCGKTTLLDVLIGLVWKPLPASNISPAVIYRVVEAIGGTIVIDEADTFIQSNPEIHGIINSGHRKSFAYVLRCDGDDHEPRRFSTWAPNIIAMIGKPKDTIVDRSILIEMRRKKPDDKVQRFTQHNAEKELRSLASKIARWSQDHFALLCEADPVTPEGLNDRAADNWRPLLAIASLIGGDCPETARMAAIALAESDTDEENSSVGAMLLADIQSIFENESKRERISTEELLSILHEMEDRPWPEWYHGKPISARQVAKKLKPFGIAPKKLRFGYDTGRGYEVAQFKDAFSRYLSGTAEQSSKNNVLSENLSGTQAENVPDKNGSNVLINKECSVVPHTGGERGVVEVFV